jgi:hypothetical protein
MPETCTWSTVPTPSIADLSNRDRHDVLDPSNEDDEAQKPAENAAVRSYEREGGSFGVINSQSNCPPKFPSPEIQHVKISCENFMQKNSIQGRISCEKFSPSTRSTNKNFFFYRKVI